MKKSYLNLIKIAQSLPKKHKLTEDCTYGQGRCALLSKSGAVYTGISVSASCGLGTCGEYSAITALLQSGESEIEVIVSINSAGKVVPSCGRCRELLYQINRKNLKTQIFVSQTKLVTLEKLLPYRWQDMKR